MNQISEIEFERSRSGRLTRAERERVVNARLKLVCEMAAAGEDHEAILLCCNALPCQPLKLKDIPALIKYAPKLLSISATYARTASLVEQAKVERRVAAEAVRTDLRANLARVNVLQETLEQADRAEHQFYLNKVRDAEERRKAKRAAKMAGLKSTETQEIVQQVDPEPTAIVVSEQSDGGLVSEVSTAPPPTKLLNMPSTAAPPLPDLVITGKTAHQITARSPSAVLTVERSKAMERLQSVRVLGPARTCQTVTDPGQFGFGVEFCGKPSTAGKSYCSSCAVSYFIKVSGFRAPPWA